MGIFDFFKRKEQSPAPKAPNYQAIFNNYVEIAKKCVGIINKTTEIDAYFYEYNTLIDALDNMIAIESYVKFSGLTPRAQKQTIMDGHEEQNMIFIRRTYEYAVENGTIADFFSKMEAHYFEMTQKNIAYIENLKSDKAQPSKDFTPQLQIRTDKTTVYYAYGHVIRVFPPIKGKLYENRDIINGADFIVSDGVAYDLTDPESIKSIAVPNYQLYSGNKVGEELGVTGVLDYVLRMKSGQLWTDQKYDLSIAILEKATELMKHSTIGWSKKDFYRIVNELNDLGKFKKAKEWEDWIDKNFPDVPESFQDLYEECDLLDTDLVDVGTSGVCCEKCAMYRNRIFSVGGTDKRFPKLPVDFHTDCGLRAYPFIYGIMEPTFECDDVIKYSNRPFVDDRTEEEIKNREEWLDKIAKLPPAKREPNLAKIIYLRLKKQMPEIAPKSFSGFQRMRNANSKNYQALVKKAEEAGFVFPQSLDEVAAWEDDE